MPLPSPLYVACFPLQEFFINKDDGTPLSNGVVTFYEDNGLTSSVPKSVYMQVEAPNNVYSFVDIGNVIILSSVGTPQYNGSDFIPFLYPYVGDPADWTPATPIQLYYVTVYASQPPVGNGSLQFTREAWPPNAQIGGGGGGTVTSLTETDNMLANPQFVEVNFIPNTANVDPTTFIYTVTGVGLVNDIAPDWKLVTNSAGTVTVSQRAYTDVVPTNPPYVLEIVSNLTTPIYLTQRLFHSPRLFANEIVSGSFIARSQDGIAHQLILSYIPSDAGATTHIIAQGPTTMDNNWAIINQGENGTPGTPIDGFINSDAAVTGYVDIQLTIPPNCDIQVSSFQLLEVATAASAPAFLEESTARQVDHLFHDYFNPLSFKPIPSYLVGWDFPLNPTQFGTAPTLGAYASQYVWDQTILWLNSTNITVLRAGGPGLGGIQLNCATAPSQAALIQYIDQPKLSEIMLNDLSVNVVGCTTSAATVQATIQIWITTSSTLPNCAAGTGLSIISTIGAAGGVATTNGSWQQITREGNLGDAVFTLGPRQANGQFNSYGFTGWSAFNNSNTQPLLQSATYAAIVIGFAVIPVGEGVVLQSVSLVPGNIPTPPAPQTYDEVLRECQYYYETSVAPTSVFSSHPGLYASQFANISGGVLSAYATTFTTVFNTAKRASNIAYFQTYSSTNGTPGNVDFNFWSGGVAQGGNNLSNACFTFSMGNNKNVVAIGNTSAAQLSTVSPSSTALPWVAVINYNFSYDARLGILL